MESEEQPSNWIPTFPSVSETGEADSINSFQSVLTTGSAAVDLPSNDQSLDVCQQNQTASNKILGEKTTIEPATTIDVFEEDARSSWSEEPKLTEFKETAIDEAASQNSVCSQKSVSSQKGVGSPKSLNSQKSISSPKSLNSQKSIGSPKSENSQKSIGSPKSENSQKSIGSPKSENSQKSIGSPKSENSQKSVSSPKSVISQKSTGSPKSVDSQKSLGCHKSASSQKSVTSPKSESCQKIVDSPKSLSGQKCIGSPKSESNQKSIHSPKSLNSPKSVNSPKNVDSCENVCSPKNVNSFESVISPKIVDKSICSPKGVNGHESICSPKSGNGHESISSPKSGNGHESISSPKSGNGQESICSPKSIDSPKSVGSPKSENDDPSPGSPKDIAPDVLLQSCAEEVKKREFPPENLYEYMWPQENGELYILQEQICDYLSVKSFKRKYPDLVRRTVEMDEKQFLKEKEVVTEMQCDLGLTALRSEDVLELMSKDYPEHYSEYIKVLREREQQSINEKQKELAAANSDKNKMFELIKKAVQSAADYNAHLNQERREERKSCMDLQTFTIHYPVKKEKLVKKYTKPGKYPVALLPGQFQDYYKEYTPDELKYLPLNTVLYGPLKELNSIKASLSDGSQSDSDDSTASDGSESSSQGTHDDSSSSSENNKKPTAPNSPYQPKVKPNAVCKVCKTGAEGKTKDGKAEELVHCSDCENSTHPSCTELTPEVVAVLKTYPWQCMDCKVCSHCKDPNDEDKMLFCDICDRGYHTFCVGLKNLPQGKWICRQCGSCSICGVNKPGPESSKAQWLYDTSKVNEPEDKISKPKLICQSCFKKKR